MLLLGQSFKQISTVFAAGVLVQSAQFPPVVSIFYACWSFRESGDMCFFQASFYGLSYNSVSFSVYFAVLFF